MDDVAAMLEHWRLGVKSASQFHHNAACCRLIEKLRPFAARAFVWPRFTWGEAALVCLGYRSVQVLYGQTKVMQAFAVDLQPMPQRMAFYKGLR